MSVNNNNNNQIEDLEDDDEFEDFGQETWDVAEEDPYDAEMWIEDWDNDDVNDEFTIQLRAELQKASAQQQQQSNQMDQDAQPR
ncbi:hypothetical protein HDU76_009327 [Blyttiomyces sp. JEL0837]|nr:hypothetical protein HDU76_009327 [Blyttiomyces sp. JEL0837]